MYHIIVKTIGNNNVIAWSESDFLFREYLKAMLKRTPFMRITVEYCETEDDLKWIFKKYNVPDTKISGSRIVLIYDRNKIIFGVTTCRSQRTGLGGRSLFESTEDTIRSTYVSTLLWYITYLKRFSNLESFKLDVLYDIVKDKYLDRHNIDINRYMIESNECSAIYKI